MTLNLNYFVDKHGTWPSRRDLIREVIREAGPDIITFQAVAKDPRIEDGKDQAMQFCELLDYNHHFFQPAQSYDNGRQEGSAIISKIPFAEKDYQLLTLLKTEDPFKRVILRAKFDLKEGPLYLFNGHFSWVAEQARENIRESLAYMSGITGRALLTGDLNTPPDSDLFLPFKQAGWVDAWNNLYPDQEGFTFESNKLFTRIDYAWVNFTLKDQVQRVELLHKQKEDAIRLSDHLGLMVGLNVRA